MKRNAREGEINDVCQRGRMCHGDKKSKLSELDVVTNKIVEIQNEQCLSQVTGNIVQRKKSKQIIRKLYN